MTLVALICALALLAYKVLDNHERRLRREHEVRIADVYRIASESVRKHEADVEAIARVQRAYHERIQHLEQWQQTKKAGELGRGRS